MDEREFAALKFGIMDTPDYEVSPFVLKKIRLDAEDSEFMLDVIQKRLAGRIWEEIDEEAIGSEKFISREFVARDSDNKARSVADLSHLSDHYKPVPTKKTLEGFSASLLPRDYLITMDLKSGYNHFRLHKDMRKYFVVSVLLADGTVRYFKYIVLPFGWTRSGHWFCRLVARFWTMVKRSRGFRVCCYVDDFAVAPSMGRRSTQDDCKKASRYLDAMLQRYGLTRHETKGVWGSGSQVVQHLGFIIDTVNGTFGVPAGNLDKIEVGARCLLKMARCNARRVPMRELVSIIGRAQSLRLAVPDTAFRLRASYVSLHGKEGTDDGHGSWTRFKAQD